LTAFPMEKIYLLALSTVLFAAGCLATSCPENDCGEDAICNRKSKLCVCENGASTYPMCTDDDNNKCTKCQETNKYCEMTPKCCMVRCDQFETCHHGRCQCMYGETRMGECRRCMHRCRKDEKCRRGRGGKYYCKRIKKPRGPNCVPDCGPGSKCRRRHGTIICLSCGPGTQLSDGQCVNCDSKCGPGSTCRRVNGVISCLSCGPGTKLNDGQCVNCDPKCGTGSTCKRVNGEISCLSCGPGTQLNDGQCVNCSPQCGPGSTCRQAQGIVTCLTCSHGRTLLNNQCITGSWSGWSFTQCSKTCLNGNDLGEQFAERKCQPPGAHCYGDAKQGPFNCPQRNPCMMMTGGD